MKIGKNKISAKSLPWLYISILVIFVLCSVFAPLIAPYSPTAMDLRHRLSPPLTKGHLLGTDTLGRDMLSRILYGGRTSLLVAMLVLLVSGTLGLTVGITSAYIGGKTESVLMRIVDIFLSFPPILVAIVFAVSMGPGLGTVVAAISFTYWARFSRSIRAEALQVKQNEFIALAKVAGCSPVKIMIKHILPNVLDTFVVVATLQIGQVITLESTLSFLGAGLPVSLASWGRIVGDGRDYISTAWWICTFSGLALALVVLAFNQLGDWFRDARDPYLAAIMAYNASHSRSIFKKAGKTNKGEA